MSLIRSRHAEAGIELPKIITCACLCCAIRVTSSSELKLAQICVWGNVETTLCRASHMSICVSTIITLIFSTASARLCSSICTIISVSTSSCILARFNAIEEFRTACAPRHAQAVHGKFPWLLLLFCIKVCKQHLTKLGEITSGDPLKNLFFLRCQFKLFGLHCL